MTGRELLRSDYFTNVEKAKLGTNITDSGYLYYMSVMNMEFRTPWDFVSYCFVWEDTPEGNMYWCELYSRLIENGLKTDILSPHKSMREFSFK